MTSNHNNPNDNNNLILKRKWDNNNIIVEHKYNTRLRDKVFKNTSHYSINNNVDSDNNNNNIDSGNINNPDSSSSLNSTYNHTLVINKRNWTVQYKTITHPWTHSISELFFELSKYCKRQDIITWLQVSKYWRASTIAYAQFNQLNITQYAPKSWIENCYNCLENCSNLEIDSLSYFMHIWFDRNIVANLSSFELKSLINNNTPMQLLYYMFAFCFNSIHLINEHFNLLTNVNANNKTSGGTISELKIQEIEDNLPFCERDYGSNITSELFDIIHLMSILLFPNICDSFTSLIMFKIYIVQFIYSIPEYMSTYINRYNEYTNIYTIDVFANTPAYKQLLLELLQLTYITSHKISNNDNYNKYNNNCTGHFQWLKTLAIEDTHLMHLSSLIFLLKHCKQLTNFKMKSTLHKYNIINSFSTFDSIIPWDTFIKCIQFNNLQDLAVDDNKSVFLRNPICFNLSYNSILSSNYIKKIHITSTEMISWLDKGFNLLGALHNLGLKILEIGDKRIDTTNSNTTSTSTISATEYLHLYNINNDNIYTSHIHIFTLHIKLFPSQLSKQKIYIRSPLINTSQMVLNVSINMSRLNQSKRLYYSEFQKIFFNPDELLVNFHYYFMYVKRMELKFPNYKISHDVLADIIKKCPSLIELKCLDTKQHIDVIGHWSCEDMAQIQDIDIDEDNHNLVINQDHHNLAVAEQPDGPRKVRVILKKSIMQQLQNNGKRYCTNCIYCKVHDRVIIDLNEPRNQETRNQDQDRDRDQDRDQEMNINSNTII